MATSERERGDVAASLPTATFISFFAIAFVEFAVPFVAVTRLGATSAVVAVLGICRFAPQALASRAAARLVERVHQRSVMLISEGLRVVAFAVTAMAVTLGHVLGLIAFGLANVALAIGSVLTAVATQALVPAIFADDELPRIYSSLGVAESSADAAAPFLTGLILAAVGLPTTFAIAAALALAALALMSRIPRIRVIPADADLPLDEMSAPSSLRAGLRLNLAPGPLRTITLWSMSYNFGQSLMGALLVIVLIRTTPISSTSWGAMQTGAVVFAVIGSFAADRLPQQLRSGLGTAVFGCGAVASYALVGIGAYAGGITGLVVVLLGFVIDEFCSGVVLVRLQTYRARAVAARDRPMATAAYRLLNLTAVPAGYMVGGVLGLVVPAAWILLIAGSLMILPGFLMTSRTIRRLT